MIHGIYLAELTLRICLGLDIENRGVKALIDETVIRSERKPSTPKNKLTKVQK